MTAQFPYAKATEIQLNEALFCLNQQRIEHLSSTERLSEHYQVEELSLNASKNLLNQPTLTLLIKLATQAGLKEMIEAMFTGELINTTEQRAVLHVALRNPQLAHSQLIHAQMAKMRELVKDIVEKQTWQGFEGKAITDVVNIGIGGSDLGPRMVHKALTPFHTSKIKVHFISNVDGAELHQLLPTLNPGTTLFILASKSFTTQETLLNAQTARQWLIEKAQDSSAIAKHFIAITSRPDKAIAFGIDANNILEMWDFVGGRYSLWSTIGLPIALAVGMRHFEALLSGGRIMDEHFRHTEFSQNLPVLLGLIGIWHRNFLGFETQALLPYDERLALLPNYLQQADMESNGKQVKKDGSPVTSQTGPIIWGGVGTNGQHAFHQLLHQGTTTVPVDFIIAKEPHHPYREHHEVLWAHALAQSEALMIGKSLKQATEELLAQGLSLSEAQQLAPHKVIPGNKPSNFITIKSLTPKTLGMLSALYEHKIFTQSVIWEINAFDQWGVELGKQLAGPILEKLQAKK